MRPEHFTLFGQPVVTLHVGFAVSDIARRAAVVASLRVVEPGAGTVHELLSHVRGRFSQLRQRWRVAPSA